MKTIYIADLRSNNNEGRCTGHYIPVARNYTDIIGHDANVKIAAGRIYGDSFEPSRMLWLPFCVSSRRGILHTIIGKLKSLFNCYVLLKKAEKNAIIILQHATVITSCVGLLMFAHRRDLKIFMILYTKEPLQTPLQRLLFRLVKKKLQGVLCPTEEIARAFGLPYCVVPDYVYTGQRQELPAIPYERKKYDFCLMGRFNQDKGVVEILRLLRDKPYRVLVAGRPDSPEYDQQIREAIGSSPHIELHLGFIETEQYTRYMAESRYCILNYQAEYGNRSSGVVYDTLFAGVPVIGCASMALNMVQEHSLGYLYTRPEEVCWDEFLCKEKHETYLRHIEVYRTSHCRYQEKIKNFIL